MTNLSRRRALATLAASAAGLSASGWFPAFAQQAASDPNRKRHCILLWMSGGPAQTDTFDLKPGRPNGGEFQEIATVAPGLRFSEHLPRLAQQADKLAVVRSLSTKEGDHGRATYLMRTGQKPTSVVQYPAIGASLARQLSDDGIDRGGLPGYVSIGAYRAFNADAYGPGFLGPRYGPLMVAATDMMSARSAPANGSFPVLKVESLERAPEISEPQMNRRLQLWNGLQRDFLTKHSAAAPGTHDAVYRNAIELMQGAGAGAFDLTGEPDALREKYGRTIFGQGCLLARRLIERQVSFVEVSLGLTSGGVGWDTHANNFPAVKQLSAELDAGWSTLLEDLDQRGLLEITTILWMGEFGRTPRINGNAGRDHFPNAWSCVFAGGGIRGGQAYGRTSDDGIDVVEGKVGVTDVLATLCAAVGVDPRTMQPSNTGRPIAIVDGKPIRELLA